MKNNIILPYKMYQFRALIVPIRFPVPASVQAPLPGGADIADRGVKPYVKDFPFCFREGDFDAPIQISCHCTGLQSAIDPTLALPQYVGLPVVFMLFEDPFPQKSFMFIQGKVPVFGSFFYRFAAAE